MKTLESLKHNLGIRLIDRQIVGACHEDDQILRLLIIEDSCQPSSNLSSHILHGW
jgi:hypothetical protein